LNVAGKVVKNGICGGLPGWKKGDPRPKCLGGEEHPMSSKAAKIRK
jgi:hypothetical protein